MEDLSVDSFVRHGRGGQVESAVDSDQLCVGRCEGV